LKGAKPKPRRLRAVDGTRRPGKPGAPLAPQAPERPDWDLVFPGDGQDELRRDGAAIWDNVVPKLDATGVLSSVDEQALTDLAVCWARLRHCEVLISREGMAVKGERGTQKHPALTAANMYRQQLRYYLSEFGLTASSRSRLDFPEPEGADDAEARVFGS
jgi:P27 family predicted phage terminase small subunit